MRGFSYLHSLCIAILLSNTIHAFEAQSSREEAQSPQQWDPAWVQEDEQEVSTRSERLGARVCVGTTVCAVAMIFLWAALTHKIKW